MSPVFLSNVDDYLAPSQACINPLFSDTNNNNNNNNNNDSEKPVSDETMTTTPSTIGTGVIVPRKRTGRVRKRPPSSSEAASTDSIGRIEQSQQSQSSELTNKISASMADCLACSGCVTSAETVLLEQHSLSTLVEKLQQFRRDASEPSSSHEQLKSQSMVVVTLSSASLADLVRHLQQDQPSKHQYDSQSQQQQQQLIDDDLQLSQQLATFFHQLCGASIVLHGHIPLQWSLMEAAHEFCHAYRQKQQQRDQQQKQRDHSDQPIAESTTTTSTTTTTHRSFESHMPLLSASCPALVCLVEKSHASLVPHLATSMSPMSMAATYFQQHDFNNINHQNDDDNNNNNNLNDNHNNNKTNVFHIAIMPCHDKKLEASRHDLISTKSNPSVVLTTTECLEWMEQEYQTQIMKHFKAATTNNSMNDPTTATTLRDYILQTMPPAPTVSSLQDLDIKKQKVVWVVPPSSSLSSVQNESSSDAKQSEIANAFYAHGSGGYADYIFRFAAQELFGYTIPCGEDIMALSSQLPWKPVMAQRKSSKPISARLAKQSQHYSVTLYHYQPKQSDNSTNQQHDHDDDDASTMKTASSYDGSSYYSMEEPPSTTNGGMDPTMTVTPVLRFATAYGFQSLQRLLQQQQEQEQHDDNTAKNMNTMSVKSTKQVPSFDYMEAMACPSSCLNGGGQIRATWSSSSSHDDKSKKIIDNSTTTTMSSIPRETPTQTRLRIEETKQHYKRTITSTSITKTKWNDNNKNHSITTHTTTNNNNDDIYQSLCPSGPFGMEAQRKLHTQYHVVPPMQHTMGVAAGVTVQDIQW